MAAYGRLLLLIAAGCLTATSLEMGLFKPASTVTPSTGKGALHKQDPRIWYPTDAYPLLLLPDGHREVVRSVLNITKPMHFGNYIWNEAGIPLGRVWVRIDLSRQILSIFREGHEIGSAVILYGAGSKETPAGNFSIQEKRADYYSHTYDAPMPYMLRLTNDGVAIHGSDVREGWATHGCIGVPMGFARLLFAAASNGDLVVILPTQTPLRKI
jgi:hypothetical protein